MKPELRITSDKQHINKTFPLHAYGIKRNLILKDVRQAHPDFKRYSSTCLILEREDQQIFLFSFGAVVFFNVPTHEHNELLLKYGLSTEAQIENSDLAEDTFAIKMIENTTRVEFNIVTLPEIDSSSIHLAALILAQSSALDVIEKSVSDSLKESERMTSILRSNGWVRRKRRKLLQFLGESMSAKHRIVDQLSIFSEPEKTWTNEDYYNLFQQLRENFEIEKRVHQVERMLDISADSTRLLVDVVDVRRLEVLEVIIILLIAIEVVKSMYAWF